MVNERTFRQWWDIFHERDEVVELRLIGGKDTLSGYFASCDEALQALAFVDTDGVNIYSPFNRINPACANRVQAGQFKKLTTKQPATSDTDIVSREWLMIDFDPERPAGINSSESEKKAAYRVMRKVGIFLRDQGFRPPVVTMSGNGWHLYYKIQLQNTKGNMVLISDFLKVLDGLFSDDECRIDCSVFNASRITKVIGSVSYKGLNSEERPCRESYFVQVPEYIQETLPDVIKNVAGILPDKKEEPSRFNGYRTDFNIDDFIEEHGIKVKTVKEFSGGKKYILEECPFNPEHKAPDAAIFVMNSGAIGFRCLHNSCSSFTWRDVRMHYDPTAYSRRDYDEFEKRKNLASTADRPRPVVLEESDDKGRKWLSLKEIEWQDPAKLTYIPTGFCGIDDNIGGLALGDVSIISGLAGAGKTSIINNLLLSAIQHGYKAAVWSGELSPARFKSWINQAAAGRNFVRKSVERADSYYCPSETSKRIDGWTDGKLFLYNNNYGNRSSQILKDVHTCVKDRGTQLLIFDNKMAMNLDSWFGDKNEREAGLINELKDFALASKLHIILVCHPRKEVMSSLLRMESIAGNSDLYNCAANVFLCHRVGKDFERRATEFFGTQETQELCKYDEVIEIAKNRSHGRIGVVTGLYWEGETRRYLNTIGEYVVYGWCSELEMPPEPKVQEWGREDYIAALTEAQDDFDGLF